MNYQKRNPVTVLLLSVITCGIYGWIVIYQISDEIRRFRDDNTINPGLEVLLCIITCGIYEIYWYYKYGKFVYDMQMKVGVENPSDMSTVLLLLPIFKLGVVSLLLMQTELNKVWDKIA